MSNIGNNNLSSSRFYPSGSNNSPYLKADYQEQLISGNNTDQYETIQASNTKYPSISSSLSQLISSLLKLLSHIFGNAATTTPYPDNNTTTYHTAPIATSGYTGSDYSKYFKDVMDANWNTAQQEGDYTAVCELIKEHMQLSSKKDEITTYMQSLSNEAYEELQAQLTNYDAGLADDVQDMRDEDIPQYVTGIPSYTMSSSASQSQETITNLLNTDQTSSLANYIEDNISNAATRHALYDMASKDISKFNAVMKALPSSTRSKCLQYFQTARTH